MEREMNAEKAANDMKRVAEEVKKIDDVQAAFLAGHVRGMMDAIKMKSGRTANRGERG